VLLENTSVDIALDSYKAKLTKQEGVIEPTKTKSHMRNRVKLTSKAEAVNDNYKAYMHTNKNFF
jgi:hypothetical protein